MRIATFRCDAAAHSVMSGASLAAAKADECGTRFSD